MSEYRGPPEELSIILPEKVFVKVSKDQRGVGNRVVVYNPVVWNFANRPRPARRAGLRIARRRFDRIRHVGHGGIIRGPKNLYRLQSASIQGVPSTGSQSQFTLQGSSATGGSLALTQAASFARILADINSLLQLKLLANKITAVSLSAVIITAQKLSGQARRLELESFILYVKALSAPKTSKPLISGPAPQILLHSPTYVWLSLSAP